MMVVCCLSSISLRSASARGAGAAAYDHITGWIFNQWSPSQVRVTAPIPIDIPGCSSFTSGINSNDHARRLIQTAHVCFQQLRECDDLNDEQKQWIQTWMDAVANVISHLASEKANLQRRLFT
jgi:hypothetical protein